MEGLTTRCSCIRHLGLSWTGGGGQVTEENLCKYIIIYLFMVMYTSIQHSLYCMLHGLLGDIYVATKLIHSTLRTCLMKILIASIVNQYLSNAVCNSLQIKCNQMHVIDESGYILMTASDIHETL